MALFRQDSLNAKPCTCGCTLFILMVVALGGGLVFALSHGGVQALWHRVFMRQAPAAVSPVAPSTDASPGGRFNIAEVEARCAAYYGPTWVTPRRHALLIDLNKWQVGITFTRKDFPSLTFAIPHTVGASVTPAYDLVLTQCGQTIRLGLIADDAQQALQELVTWLDDNTMDLVEIMADSRPVRQGKAVPA